MQVGLKTGLRVTLAVAVLAVGPRESAGEGRPQSPWLRFGGKPPPEGAIGVLAGSTSEPNHFHVTWADGSSSDEVETDLVPTPEPGMLPTLGRLKWPAVFDASEGMALIAGRRGWGWTPFRDNNGIRLMRFEDRMQSASEGLEEEIKTTKESKGYHFHFTNLIVLEPQTLRKDPRHDAARARRADGTAMSPCESSEKLRPTLGMGPDVPSTPLLPSPVRIVERRGDWAKVILPRKGIPWHQCFDRAVIAWDRNTAGWARLTKPGPVAGTRLRQWSLKAWGAWP